jgi:hypothetical protein
LKLKDAEHVLHFSDINAVHGLYNMLLNFVLANSKARNSSGSGPQTQIIAPAPFINCFYKECSLLFKGKVNF